MQIVTLDDLAWWRTTRREFRTPKGYLLLIMALLAVPAVAQAGPARALPGLVGAATTAALLDCGLLRLPRGRWRFPDGGLLTGLILGLILDPREGWYVAAVVAALAIFAKHALRVGHANVFNPAALGLVAAYFAFGSAESWWGALPALPAPFVALPLATALFIANRVNKLPAVFAFGGTYLGLCTLIALLGEPGRVAEVFRVPDINALIFFAGFMLVDPPTSPARYPNQVRFGVIVAVVGATLFLALGGVYALPAALLVGNAWETWERARARARRGRVLRPAS